MKKTSTFQNGLIWFGAGVSLAEILTGTAFAPLGMAKGFAAILLGHIIGCAMMLLAGLIGGRTGRSAMETVKMSFGQKGGLLFAFLNVLQLVGWTAIMIYDGALAVGGIFAIGRWVWCLVIGALIIVWIAVGVTDLGWINKITMAALFILTLVLCKVIFFTGNAMVGIDGESLTFGAAVELAVAMPLSGCRSSATTPATQRSRPRRPGSACWSTARYPAGCTSSAWARPSLPASMTLPSSWSRPGSALPR